MPPSLFHATRWTLVTRAKGRDESARAALSELCGIYYDPVLRFIQSRSPDPDAGRELTHAFFEDLLSRESIGSPDPARGRFRSYLLGAVKHFLARRNEAANRQKRGGQLEAVEFDERVAEGTEDDPQFDRDWAFAVIRRAHESLGREMADAGKERHFHILRPWLDGGPAGSRGDACRELGLEPNALNVAIHRLRERFRAIVRAEIESTLNDPSELRAEFTHLVEIIARQA